MGKQKNKITFKLVYLCYVAILAVLVLAAVLYVRSVLKEYELAQPERQVQGVIAQLAEEAAGGTLFTRYGLPSVSPGPFEEGKDPQAAYLALYGAEEMSFSQSGGSREAGELSYWLENGGFRLARVKLRAVGEPVTRLGILTSRTWEVEEVQPILEARDYTLTVPNGFQVRVNGIALTREDSEASGARRTVYRVPGLYLKPEFEITGPDGRRAEYTIKNGEVLPELYDYVLTLPGTLTVTVDGAADPGEVQDNGMVRYDILRMEKPEVVISDRFGNTVEYAGGDKLPLTYGTLTAMGCTVRVEGQVVQPDSTEVPADFVHFADYVPDLPKTDVYRIAVLKEDAQIEVTDRNGNPAALPEGHVWDLTGSGGGLDEVPAQVSGEIDVLDVAQKWSLLMSNDLSFRQLSGYLIKGSYQYDIAYKYATGIDITFTSSHVLLDPAFTDVTVDNFVWITDSCFSVDIGFVKHMRLGNGTLVDDPMRDRFYFVRYEDAWKLVGMKEVVDDGGE